MKSYDQGCMKNVRLITIHSRRHTWRYSNGIHVGRYASVTTSAELVHGIVRSITRFGHAVFHKLVCRFTFSEFIQAFDTRPIMVWGTISGGLPVVNMAMLRKQMTIWYDEISDPKPFPVAGPLGSWSDRSSVCHGMILEWNNTGLLIWSRNTKWSWDPFFNSATRISSNLGNETNIINEVNWPLYAP